MKLIDMLEGYGSPDHVMLMKKAEKFIQRKDAASVEKIIRDLISYEQRDHQSADKTIDQINAGLYHGNVSQKTKEIVLDMYAGIRGRDKTRLIKAKNAIQNN